MKIKITRQENLVEEIRDEYTDLNNTNEEELYNELIEEETKLQDLNKELSDIEEYKDIYNNQSKEKRDGIEEELKNYLQEFKSLNTLYTRLSEQYEHAYHQKQAQFNNLLNIGANILSRQDSLIDLLRPNSVHIIKDEIADNIKKSLMDTGKENFINYKNDTDIFSPTVINEVYKAFVGGKKTLGIAALQPPLTQLFQKVGAYTNRVATLNNKSYPAYVYLNTELVNIGTEENPDWRHSLSSSYDSERKYLKSEIFSQYVNAYVDIAKEPFIFYMNAGNKVAPILMYMGHLGIPVKQAAYFVNQSSIRNYIKRLSSIDTISNRLMNDINKTKYTKVHAMVDTWNEFSNIQLNTEDFSSIDKDTGNRFYKQANFYKRITNEFKKYLTRTSPEGNVGNALVKQKLSTDSLVNNLNSLEPDKDTELLSFMQYIFLEIQSASLREVTNELKSDTTLSKSITGALNQTRRLTKFSQKDSKHILPGEVVEKISKQTEIAPFIKVQKIIYNLYKGIEVLQTNHIVNEQLIKMLDDPKTTQSQYEQERLIKEYLNDLLIFIVQNRGKVEGNKFIKENDKEFWNIILKDKEENINENYIRLKNNPNLEELSEIFNYIKPNRSFYTNLLTMKWVGPSIKADSINSLSNEWRKYMNLTDPKFADVTSFFKDLAEVTFLSYGENRSKDSFFSIVPSEKHANYILPYIKDFLENIENPESPTYEMFISHFNDMFKRNNHLFFKSLGGRSINDRRFKQYSLKNYERSNGELGFEDDLILTPIEKLKREYVEIPATEDTEEENVSTFDMGDIGIEGEGLEEYTTPYENYTSIVEEKNLPLDITKEEFNELTEEEKKHLIFQIKNC